MVWHNFISDELSCKIDICVYSINKLDILLPTEAPQPDGYIFVEWEKKIGSNPGVSNRIPALECLEKEINTFIPSSITLGECSSGKNKFAIYGDWENKNKSMPYVHYYDFNLLLDNENNKTSICNYIKSNPIHFQCKYEGTGKIKFKEQFLRGYSELYKIKEFDSGKTVKKCSDKDNDNDEDEDIMKLLTSSFYFLNKFLIIFYLLLY